MHSETPRRSKSKTLYSYEEAKCLYTHTARTILYAERQTLHSETRRRSKSKTLYSYEEAKCLYTHTAKAFQRRYFRIDFRDWERSRSSATSSDKLRKDDEKGALKGFCPCAGTGDTTKPPDAPLSHPDNKISRRAKIRRTFGITRLSAPCGAGGPERRLSMQVIEIVVIIAAVLFVVAVTGVSLWRKAHGKGGCSACGGCGGCGGCAGGCCGKESKEGDKQSKASEK